MDLVYKVNWPQRSNPMLPGHCDIIMCAWSSSNLLAFTVEKQVNGFLKQYVCVLNPNQPWDVFKTHYKGGEITCIQWDHTGTKFLTGDSHGLCCLWTMPNSLINMWTAKSKLSIDLKGEEIIAVGWLHHGIRVLFNIERLEAPYTSEKFDRMKFRPSVMQYGGKPMDGYILVTGTGLVTVRLLKSETEIIKGEANLNISTHQQIANITFTSQGKILILTSDGNIDHLIQFHEISVMYDSEDGKLNIEVESLPGLPTRSGKEDISSYTHISHVNFFPRENEDKIQVVVCLSGPSGSKFVNWLLRKDVTQLHRMFQSMTASAIPKLDELRSWQFVTQSADLPRVTSFSIPTITITTSSAKSKLGENNKFYSGCCIAVALADNTIQILHSILLNPLVVKHLPETTTTNVTSPGKRAKTTQPSCVRSVTFSAMSCALVTIDNLGSLSLYKVPPWLNSTRNSDSEQAMKQIVHLLIYCLLTGQEWWDVLLHVQPHVVDPLISQLTSGVAQQPAYLQQVLQSRLHAMKITIYHLSGSPASMDCHLILLFDAISLVFRSLLRPHQQVTTENTDPAIRLKAVSCSSLESNIDKLLLNVDTDPQTLQSMQQLIQWVADVTLYLLASAPITLFQKQTNRPGASLYRNRPWLSILREMLVIIRVWGLLKSACSPIFTLLDTKLDVLAHAYKLVTSLWQTSGDMKEPDPAAMNECSLLSCQLVIPPLEVIPPPNGILNHIRSYRGEAKFVFGEPQADMHLTSSRQQTMDYVNNSASSGKIDALRRVFLGKTPNQDLKECTRCGITTMYNSMPRTTLKVWDQRFIKSCLCGGHWRLVTSSAGFIP
uniref:Mediator of RNA polymerase II transcription subunit 16 n=1 Tax=Phallusia mammillata TaxID=59560 RepID=A0A6F9DL66_9ASCI|nr:mediator of RNA polymerase II transcription subunit 16-like [Phallusia mammillata]